MILLDSLAIFLHFQFASEYKDQWKPCQNALDQSGVGRLQNVSSEWQHTCQSPDQIHQMKLAAERREKAVPAAESCYLFGSFLSSYATSRSPPRG